MEDGPTAVGPSMDSAVEIAALQARIESLEAALARMGAMQTAIAHGISHDLRAPLRVIDGFAAQLASGLQEDDAALQQVARIRAAASRMGSLIDGLLDFSRTVRAELRPSEVDIGFLLDWAVMDLQGLFPGLRVEVEAQPGLQVLGDERLLRALFDKVLDNSRKFAKPGEAMSLRIHGQREGDMLHVTIADEGIGMALRDAQQPFEPFMRLHGSREGAGDGLGLAIVQAIVQQHGGRVWMTSVPGQGSQVHVVLPAPPAD